MGDINIHKHHKDPETKCFLQHLRTDSFLVSPGMGVKLMVIIYQRMCSILRKPEARFVAL